MELLHYILSRRNIEVHSEIICRTHYDAAPTMSKLSVREVGAGYRQTADPYTEGDRPCETCYAIEVDQRIRRGMAPPEGT